jgi:hypothetical protein
MGDARAPGIAGSDAAAEQREQKNELRHHVPGSTIDRVT